MAMTIEGLAFMFSSSILLQILACAIYNNWWPMLSALMYVLVPMPCLFFWRRVNSFSSQSRWWGMDQRC
ncbi:vacuolar sorting-associated 55 homolog isoform X1 [Olea europaea subsp. europaea]|uniref:Vacuolar sorting-associated 55 homolog isoform X1 n=1 Tax=Olea europaea subsp. europaea TaxID=158383 RepID=A0A8S0UA09_OLEEU|nr:vacuolar sorting-associated 55 homolog isoform X1 [Olea europaea subsp. europaea]